MPNFGHLILSFLMLGQAQILAPTPGGAVSQGLPWYQVVGGIIAIPVTLLGLVYTLAAIRKANVETQKVMLDIRKAELESPSAFVVPIDNGDLSETLTRAAKIGPVVKGVSIQFILLRFVVLYLLVQAYGIFETIYGFLTQPLLITLNFWLSRNAFAHNPNPLIPSLQSWIINTSIQLLPTIGYWLIFFAIGWPLFRDANAVVGVRLRDVLPFRRSADGSATSREHPGVTDGK